MSVPGRWENGSEFAWPGVPAAPREGGVPWDGGLLLSSGRDALRVVLEAGVTRHGWRRLWVPEYFCQHVVAALRRPDLELVPYPDHPLLTDACPPAAVAGDAVLVMNYFGLRTGFPAPERAGVHLVEDHSHDPTSPWARHSTADFCVVSLRKTVPLSDGGAAWSPRGHPLPEPPPMGGQRRRAVAFKRDAMILKAMYLNGLAVDKGRYRELAARGERGLAVPAVSDISDVSRAVVEAFDLEGWRRARRRNVEALAGALRDAPGLRVLEAADATATPFSAVLVTGARRHRDALRQHLHAAGVYPAVLWPLERTVLPVGEEALGASRRVLSVHCDGRYDLADMARVADIVLAAWRDVA